MWRVVLAASMLLTLAFGSVADAKCEICVQSVVITTDGAGTDLRFTASGAQGVAFPETGTAVVMQFDGNRGKCLNVTLVRTSVDGDQATYVGRFNFIYQNATTISGRADLAGTIYEFSAPLDGKPGTITVSSYEGALSGVGAPAIVTPVVITPAPTLAATAAPAPAAPVQAASPIAPLIDSVTTQPALWLGLIVILVAVTSAYFDRKRSIARAAAS